MNNAGFRSFHESQRFIDKRLSFTLFLIALVFVTVAFLRGILHGPEIIGPAIMVFVVYLFYRLELIVEIKNTELLIHFSPLVKRRIPLSEIQKCEAREYRPIREFGGWGIRRSWRGKGKAYNVKGKKGVQLELKNGESLLIGSQKAEALAEAIRHRLFNPS